MKKLISILLVMMMILCMGTTAFADETPTTNISITGDADRTYYAYELLKLTTSHKTTDTTCDGTTHTDTCYNYSYTVNTTYRTILQNEVFGNALDSFWTDSNLKPTDATGITDAQILDYLSKLKSDNDGGTLRPVADRIYRAIQAANIDKDTTLENGENASVTVEQGYWLIADVTDLADDAYKANSLVMVNTKGLDTLTITPKTALPQLEKKVQDINDSEDADSFTNNAWADSADHDKDDTVPFKLTATVPDVTGYETYKMVFHDEMETGLTLKPGTVKVYKYASKNDADADTNRTSGTLVFDASGNYETDDVKLDPKNEHKFELTLKDVLEGDDKASAGTAFVVYYEATLNENAVMGSDGNSNTAYLEFSNNPYDKNGTGETPEDTVKVFTYQLTINKVDGNNNQPLKGAGFILYKKNAAGEYVAVCEEVKGADMTAFTWTHLDDGDYKLVEETVPAGYNKMEDLVFTISATHDEKSENPALTALSGGNLVTGDFSSTGIITEDVENYSGTVLPSTGAKGTMMLIGGGSVFIVLAAVFMITRKKMSIYED